MLPGLPASGKVVYACSGTSDVQQLPQRDAAGMPSALHVGQLRIRTAGSIAS